NWLLAEYVIITIYCIIFVVGLVGNICTILIIQRTRSMRTPTNYYLLNLALSDLMILICNLPLEIHEIYFKEWVFSKFFCKLRNISAEFFTCSSILTILGFSCERYFAIIYPMKFHQLSHFRRAVHIIVIIWIISLTVSLPVGLSFDVIGIRMVSSKDSNQTLSIISVNDTNIKPLTCKFCTISGQYKKIFEYIVVITSFGFFYIPMFIIGTIYLLIGKELRRVNMQESVKQRQQQAFALRKSPSSSNNNNNNSNNNSSSNNNNNMQKDKSSSGNTATNKDTTNCNHKGSIHGTFSVVNMTSHPMIKLSARIHARKVVIKMLVAVVIAFFVCYAPFYFQRLITSVGNTSSSTSSFHHKSMAILFFTSGLTFYFGSIINPFLYNVVSNKYRRAFLNLFCCQLKRNTTFDQLNGGGIIAGKGKSDSIKLQHRNGTGSKTILFQRPFKHHYHKPQQEQPLCRNSSFEQNKKKLMNLHFVFQRTTPLSSPPSLAQRKYNSSFSSSLYSYRNYQMSSNNNKVNRPLPLLRRAVLNSKFDVSQLPNKSTHGET
ncbi:unnamed protein product, partial [Didymodactylos carnosus]